MVFIISLRGQVCAHNTSLTPSHFIEVPVPCQESARSYLCVGDLDVASFQDFFSPYFGTISTAPREIMQGETKLLWGPHGQAETYIKIEDLRSNKTTGKLSLMLYFLCSRMSR
jgi:hypothetical protein